MVELSKLLRGGRITSTRKDVVKYISSAENDRRLLEHIVKINQAHVVMLSEQNIIGKKDAAQILKALSQLEGIELSSSFEDAHVIVEEGVIRLAGSDVGGNLQIGKSRNDQVAAAIRMELRKEILNIASSLASLQKALIELADKHVTTLVIGYTHLQPAQPVTFAHQLLSYVDALERDLNRLMDAYDRVNMSPMGAGALATTSFPINRERVAELLSFEGILENSIDAVNARDFILEILADLTVMSTNLGRLVDDLILWGSSDFGIIGVPDSLSSTSSIMPQKKNPDLLEVIRARTGQTVSDFLKSVATLKGLPSVYNLDLQEITPTLWNSMKTMNEALFMLSQVVPHLKVKDVSEKALASFSTATELANMLVRKHGVPFRIAHKIVGVLTKNLAESNLTLKDVTPQLLRDVAKKTAGILLNVSIEDIRDSIDPVKFIEVHKTLGGPSPVEVKRMLRNRKGRLKNSQSWALKKGSHLRKAENKLVSIMNTYLSS